MRTKTIKTGRIRANIEEEIQLVDDGYRIWVTWISGAPQDIDDGEKILRAEYKECDIPYLGWVVADLLMKE